MASQGRKRSGATGAPGAPASVTLLMALPEDALVAGELELLQAHCAGLIDRVLQEVDSEANHRRRYAMAVALYARVSTPRQAEKDLSIPDQLRQLREYCKAQNLPIACEYIEPGASATDDRRPVFQQMIADAGQDPAPYAAIVVHSRSRFFRDLFEFLGYERRLKRAGVRVISITQQTSDDPAGEMASKIFSLFDEYQSKENGKHTLRAMQENARQGFCNGSRPHFGFRTVEAPERGNKGQRKKRLAIDAAEAGIVRRIFALYLNGDNGVSMGCKSIAYFLNERGITRRGQRWMRARVHEVLANPAYVGEYYFNRIDGKTRKPKPESEWVKLTVEPIIDPALFRRVQLRRSARAPAAIAPRVVSSPTLLTGLLKCACCGAGMTLATGKGGRYRYYKCNTRIGKGIDYCPSEQPADAKARCPGAQFAGRSRLYGGARAADAGRRWPGRPKRAAKNSSSSWPR